MFGGTGLFGQTPTTTTAQPGSLFGAQPTSLFGSPQPQTQQPGTGLFGSTQQQPGTGLFGAVPQQQQQQQPVTGQTSGGFGTSLFGTTPNVSAPASGGLFGSVGQPGGPSLFGAPTGQQPQQTSLFGSTQQQQQPQLGQQQPSLFGSTQQTQPGQQQQQPTSLFGSPQPQQQPQLGQQQQPTSLFGSTQPQQQPQLGQQQQPTSLFGSTQPQQQSQLGQQQSLFSSIQQTQPGQQQQQPTSLFGSTQPQTQPGQQQQQQPTSLFGSTQPQQGQQQPGTGLFGSNLGTVPPATSAAPPPFSFGTKLGAPTTSVAAPAAGGFTFNAPTVSSTGTTSTIPTSAPASTGGFSFGLPAATKTSTITSTTAPGTGLTFGTAPSAPTTTSTMPTLGGSLFGSPAVTSTVTTSAAPFSFGTKLGAPSTTSLPTSTMGGTSGTFSFGGIPSSTAATSSTTAATPSTGLGGVPKYASTGAETTFAFGGGSGDGKAENRALKELPLPQEMLLLVDELKNQLKSNKLKFTELTRASNETIISKVTEEIEEVRGSVTVIANLIHKQSSNCEAIRKLIQEGISNAEMANMTRETPISSQVDHTTPIQYFFRLFDSFRERMNIYLREIEKAENSLSSVLSVQSAFTSKELFNALKGTRDSVFVLSAKVQILHEEVIREIEAHRNLQRYLLGETKEFSLSNSDIRQSGFTSMKPFSTGLDKREGNNNYSKIGLLFPHKLVDPPKIQILNMTQNLSNTGKTTTPPAKTSTPFFSRIPGALQRPSKSSDSLFYPSNSLFQTQQSTILSPSQMPSTSPVPGISLKRTKH